MTDITLRPYQREFINNVRAEFISLRKQHLKPSVVGVAPCGAGKTIMTGWMIKEAVERNKRSIFFVHRKELIQQTADAFTRLEIPFGIIAAGTPMNLALPVQIASVQTLARRLKFISPPDFLICDECHHILANTYKKIIDAFPNAFLLGVTATPQRMGGITLCDAFNSMVESLSVNQLIALGNLTKFRYFAPKSNIDLSSVHSSFGEYDNDELERVMSNVAIIGDIVHNYRKLADGKSAICYCVNVEHSKKIADAFLRADIPAAHCDGETKRLDRERIVDDFRRGNIKVLCNAELFGEGFDVPNMQAVILARPTHSLTLFIQQAMRPLRPDPDDPDKVAIIIDHVQNYKEHGLPNAHHIWSLDPNNDEVRCPSCKNFVKPIVDDEGVKSCPKCGYVWTKGEGNPPPIRIACDVAGDISELDVAFDTNEQSAQIKKAPTTPEEFIAIAKERKYKIGWAAYRAAEFAKSYKDFLHIADLCGYKPGWAYHQWQNLLAQ